MRDFSFDSCGIGFFIATVLAVFVIVLVQCSATLPCNAACAAAGSARVSSAPCICENGMAYDNGYENGRRLGEEQ